MNKQAQVNLYEAKTHLSSLVERAAAGEEIVIAKNGKPMARLVACVPDKARREIPWGDLGRDLTPEQQERMAEEAMGPLPDEVWDGARWEGWPPTRAR